MQHICPMGRLHNNIENIHHVDQNSHIWQIWLHVKMIAETEIQNFHHESVQSMKSQMIKKKY